MRVALALGLETIFLGLLLVAWAVVVGQAVLDKPLRFDPRLPLLTVITVVGLQYVLVLSLLGV